MPFFVLGFVRLTAEIIKMISQISKNLMPLHTFVVHSREKEMYSNATWTKGVCELELMRLVAEMTALNKVIV